MPEGHKHRRKQPILKNARLRCGKSLIRPLWWSLYVCRNLHSLSVEKNKQAAKKDEQKISTENYEIVSWIWIRIYIEQLCLFTTKLLLPLRIGMSSWKSSQIDLWLGDSRTNKKTSPIRKLSWPNKKERQERPSGQCNGLQHYIFSLCAWILMGKAKLSSQNVSQNHTFLSGFGATFSRVFSSNIWKEAMWKKFVKSNKWILRRHRDWTSESIF